MNDDASQRVDILMATFNGASYIDLQIASILHQTHANLRLIIRDDDSFDGTKGKIEQWARDDSRIIIVRDLHSRCGSAGNFLRLLDSVDSEYVMFADQDDIWMCQKVEASLSTLRRKEKMRMQPWLLITDAISFEERKGLVSNRTQRARPENLSDFLFLNGGFYGCCMMFNRKLLELLNYDDFKSTAQHDHLISLLALTFGGVIHSNEVLMFYRKHESNVSGGPTSLFKKMKQFLVKKTPLISASHFDGVRLFVENNAADLSEVQRRVFNRYLAFPRSNIFAKMHLVFTTPFTLYGLRSLIIFKLFTRPTV